MGVVVSFNSVTGNVEKNTNDTFRFLYFQVASDSSVIAARGLCDGPAAILEVLRCEKWVDDADGLSPSEAPSPLLIMSIEPIMPEMRSSAASFVSPPSHLTMSAVHAISNSRKLPGIIIKTVIASPEQKVK